MHANHTSSPRESSFCSDSPQNVCITEGEIADYTLGSMLVKLGCFTAIAIINQHTTHYSAVTSIYGPIIYALMKVQTKAYTSKQNLTIGYTAIHTVLYKFCSEFLRSQFCKITDGFICLTALRLWDGTISRTGSFFPSTSYHHQENDCQQTELI